jgi:alpha-L-rhamnosidase
LKIGARGQREMPGLGDWCTPRGNFWDSSNSPEAAHFNNCVYAYMLECAMNTAAALGKTDDSKMYADRLKVQQKATHETSYDPATGKYLDGRQVNQAFALLAGVTPPEEVEKVMAQLEDNVLYAFPYYDTGSSGQGLYTRYFIEGGERMDLIYELLKDTRHPSYGYFLRQGHTTWPERWSAVGNSQIHTCYTGIGGYFIKGFGGTRPNNENPGMQNFIIKPAPVGDITFANTGFESMYGNIVVNWERTGEAATFHIEIPANTTAKVFIPAPSKENVTEGGIAAENATGISFIGTEKNTAVGNYIIYSVQSGVYNFSVDKLPVTAFPDPLYAGNNLSMIGRMNASSMYIVTEKDPGFEAFKANDENLETSWKSNGLKDEWLEVEWVKPQTFNRVTINEVGGNITKHKLQYWDENQWNDIITGTICGDEKTYTFEAKTTTKCRLYISEAADLIQISELSIRNNN